MYRNTYDELVAEGAALLDRAKPGWDEVIDLEVLDVQRASVCVVGQLYGSYHDGLNELGVGGAIALYTDEEMLDALGRVRGAGYGFSSADTADYPRLNAAWRRLIEARRERRTPRLLGDPT